MQLNSHKIRIYLQAVENILFMNVKMANDGVLFDATNKIDKSTALI